MIIRNSKKLLEQLSDIEERIRKVEKVMRDLGIECEQEKILKALAGQKVQHLLTREQLH